MINSGFMKEVVLFVESKIAKVRINGTYDITDFTIKRVVDRRVNMTYMIPNGVVTEVTNMALLDVNNSIISSNDVYLPITSDTDIAHTFTIVEVV